MGPTELGKMPTEEADRLRQNDEELERTWSELQTRITANSHLIRQLQGNACTIVNKTRSDVDTMLQQAENEAESALIRQSPSRNKRSRNKEVPSKMAEMALVDSNRQMKQAKETVTRILEQAARAGILSKKMTRGGTGAMSEEDMAPEETGSTTGLRTKDETERLCACAGTAAEWLRQGVAQELETRDQELREV